MSSKATQFRNIRKDIVHFIEKEGITTVSFDVFDTLLHRRCEPNAVIDGVTDWIDRYIEGQYGIEVHALESRHRVYGALIAKKADSGLDLDTTIEEMLPLWVEEMVPQLPREEKKAFEEKIFHKEEEIEQWACYANIFSLELIKELKHRGLHVIYVSDMYLGKSIVQKLLDHNGYAGLFDAGYVSGDHSLLKRTGRLFDFVLEQLQISPSEVLHIGDNYEADFVEAKKKGLRAYFIGDRLLDYKKNTNKYDYLAAKKNSKWKGYAIASFARSTPYEIGTEIEAYAKRNFGPLFSSFIHRVIERSIEEGVERIYYLSREGFLLGLIHNELVDLVPGNRVIQSAHYLYVSRLTTFLAALQGEFGLREIRSISDNVGGAVSIARLLSPFKFDRTKITEIAHCHGIEDIDAVLPHYYLFWSPFINFLKDRALQEMIAKKHAEAKELLIKLLEQERFFDARKVAIVDVGWGGQIQENIYQAIKDRSDRPDIVGFYMATNRNAHTRKSPENWMEWIVSDEAHLDWDGYASFDFVQSFEAIARAPHATVIGYKKDGTRIHPVLKKDDESSRKAEVEDDQKVLSLMQKGIMEYTDLYARAIQIYQACATDTLPYAKAKLSSALRFPTAHEATYLLSLRNSSDLGMNDILALGSESKYAKFSLSKMKRYLYDSFWKTGTAAKLWGYPMQVLMLIVTYRRKIPQKWQSLAEGIVWHSARKSTSGTDRVEDVSSRKDRHKVLFEQNYIRTWQKNCEFGERSAKKVLKRNYDAPMHLKEFLLSNIAYYFVNITLFFSGRHRFYYDGLSRKQFLLRGIVGHIAHNRFFIRFYKKFVK